jgi:hypothetical protein
VDHDERVDAEAVGRLLVDARALDAEIASFLAEVTGDGAGREDGHERARGR